MKKRLLSHILLTLLAALFLTACGPKAPYIFPDKFKQDAKILATFDEPVLFDETALLQKYFAVWKKKKSDFKKSDLMWALNSYTYKPGRYFTLSRLTFKKSWFDNVAKNANFDALNSVFAPAIITKNTPLRSLPTRDRLFKSAGSYPFDYLQDSVLPIFSPVVVSHYSKDGLYAFVHTDEISGWIWRGDLRIFTQKEAENYKKNKFGAFTKDGGAIFDKRGNFVGESRIGGFFPYVKEENDAFVSASYRFSKSYARKFEPFEDVIIKRRLNEFLGANYGWGGENLLRDCSLFLKDFYASFGVWLPRNSRAQGKAGTVFSLEGMDNEQKKEFIMANAVPYLTLFYMKGHIMLYTGVLDDEITITHAVWALRDKEDNRHQIGKVAITSIELGKGYREFKDENLLLGKITSMNIISAPKKR